MLIYNATFSIITLGGILPYLEQKNHKTYYLSKGRSNNKSLPLIGLHGGPGGSHLSLFSLTWLSDKRRVVLFDQIGSGLSTSIEKNEMKIETFVNNLDSLITHLKIDKFHLLGSSWGTTLALEYYLRKKGSGVASLTFQSPMFSTKIWEQDAKRLIKKMPLKTQKVINYCHEIGATDSKVYKEAVRDYYAKHVFRLKARPEWAPPRVINHHGERVYGHMWGPSEFYSTGTLKNYDRVKDLHKIKVPTLFLVGQYDEATPESAQRFARKIRNAEVGVIKGASHSIFTEKPELSHKRLSAFLKVTEDKLVI
ncbi:MAG: proline iminopeptidase-family hydrolase [Bacteriovoracaceae bacterium]|nr:proline iminopeptidase-family hydrolase [Bacteriovoracaceae bacterium]